MKEKTNNGIPPVILVGAGPGDSGLLTLKGKAALEQAEVVIYDQLANPALLDFAPETAEKIDVGKHAGNHTLPQAEINALLLKKAQEGKRVVRLKGGDPFIFGRGGEEAEFLVENGASYEVVPGVTAGAAVPAYAGIPVTHRAYTSAFTLITGHEAKKETSSLNWESYAAGTDTLVFFMGLSSLPEIAEKLMQFGKDPATPAAVIANGTRGDQKTVAGTLQDIAEKVQKENLPTPALIVVGDVVRLREKLMWREKQPLFGKKVLVTRAKEQAAEFSAKLRALGAEAVECPVIRIERRTVLPQLEEFLSGEQSYDWLVFTSVNGVKAFFAALFARKKDVRVIGCVKIAAIGAATARALREYGLIADIIPAVYRAEELAEALAGVLSPGERVLLPRAFHTRPVLTERIRAAKCTAVELPLYDTITETENREKLTNLLPQMDYITFASSSAVKAFSELFGDEKLPEATLAAIGPITAETARELGYEITIIPTSFTLDALTQALAADANGSY